MQIKICVFKKKAVLLWAEYEKCTIMAQVFSTYQMQILDSIAGVKSQQELCDIRNIIAEYFSNKALDAMDKLCQEGK